MLDKSSELRSSRYWMLDNGWQDITRDEGRGTKDERRRTRDDEHGKGGARGIKSSKRPFILTFALYLRIFRDNFLIQIP
jgi:hypothetical protein